jgi:hypothetical protein
MDVQSFLETPKVPDPGNAWLGLSIMVCWLVVNKLEVGGLPVWMVKGQSGVVSHTKSLLIKDWKRLGRLDELYN